MDLVDRPNTQSVVRHICVDLKAVLDRQPLMGTGPLPDWLRWKKGMVALDTYKDNLCLFRCLAVSRGCKPDRSRKLARKLASSFYDMRLLLDVPKTSLEKIEEHFKMGILVYEPTEYGD